MDVLHRVLNATQRHRIGDVARSAHHKQVAHALVESQFRRNATVGARENDHIGGLLRSKFTAQRDHVVRSRFAGYEALVTVHQVSPDFVSGRRCLTRCRVRGVLCSIGLLSLPRTDKAEHENEIEETAHSRSPQESLQVYSPWLAETNRRKLFVIART